MGVKRTALSTFVAWWIGAGWGYIAASIILLREWSVTTTIAAVLVAGLYVIYISLTPWSRRTLERFRAQRRAGKS